MKAYQHFNTFDYINSEMGADVVLGSHVKKLNVYINK